MSICDNYRVVPGEIVLCDIDKKALSTLEGLSQDEDLDEATRTTIAFD